MKRNRLARESLGKTFIIVVYKNIGTRSTVFKVILVGFDSCYSIPTIPSLIMKKAR